MRISPSLYECYENDLLWVLPVLINLIDMSTKINERYSSY